MVDLSDTVLDETGTLSFDVADFICPGVDTSGAGCGNFVFEGPCGAAWVSGKVWLIPSGGNLLGNGIF